MESNTLSRGHEFLDKIRRMKKWQKIVTALACAIVFVTTYALILPAITLTGETKVLDCNVAVHEHVDACYDEDHELACGYADFVVHEHDENCYDAKGNLVCELPEIKEHKHTDSCYETKEVLICDMEEGTEHQHTDACYEKQKILKCDNAAVLHKHSDKCYKHDEDGDVVKKDGEPVIICGKIEVKKHQHNDDCFKAVKMDKEESEEALEIAEDRIATEAAPGSDEAVEELVDQIPVNEVKSEPAEDGAVAVVRGDLPREPEVTIEKIDLQEDDIYTYFSEAKAEKISDYAAYDINITSEGEKWQPSGDQEIDVTIENPDIEVNDGQQLVLADIAENNTITDVPATVEESGDVTFDVQEETTYLLYTFTVDFHYGDLTFSIAGLDDILISELFEMLKIDRVASDVVNVTFSDPELIKVRQLEKEKDWQLISLKPFDTEETLTIEFNDGEIIVISVTDANNGAQLPTSGTLSAGNYQLDRDTTLSGDLTVSSGTVNIDLNGHKLTANGHTINVTGGTLNIDDKNSNNGDRTDVVTGNKWGRTATYSNNTLTYYVTETTVVNEATGATEERVVRHTVTNEGMIIGSTNNNTRAFRVTGGTLNLNGGYICNFKREGNSVDNGAGAAVYASAGTINLNGAVIAANRATVGGAIYVKGSNTRLNINSGCIAGNQGTCSAAVDNRNGGGGIFISGATANMNGGYVTNNTYNNHNKFCEGGGAFMVGDGGRLYINDGYITGNQAWYGGAIVTKRADSYDAGGKVFMTGGFVTANNSTEKEGGGIAIDGYGYFSMTGGYLTNNQAAGGRTQSNFQDWGGGGLFIGDHQGVAHINNVIITDNEAGGCGGGVGGCATGRIEICLEENGAIFDNDADGLHFSGSSSTKNSDHYYAEQNETFMSNGYSDYFCAFNSVVSNTTLGDGIANWSGTADGKVVSATNKEDVLEATYMMGLDSDISSGDIAKAESAAKAYINGNSSPTHGGGILANGYLLIGNGDLETYCSVELNALKQVDSSNSSRSINNRVFNFAIFDSKGDVVTTGHNDNSGKITFADKLSFNQAGTFDFFIRETTEDQPSGLIPDSTEYKMTVTVIKEVDEQQLVPGVSDSTTITKYRITNIRVTRNGSQIHSVNPTYDETHTVTLDLNSTSKVYFNNRTVDSINVYASKVWAGGTPTNISSIQVQLYKDGQKSGDQKTLNARNNWKTSWTGLDKNGSYEVKEISVPGYTPTYKIEYSVGSNSIGNVDVTITNTSVKDQDFKLNIKKIDKNKKVLMGAEFQLKNKSTGEVLTFKKTGDEYSPVASGTSGSVKVLTTNANGMIYVTKIKGGTYQIIETKAPTGYGIIDNIPDIVLDENTPNATYEVEYIDPDVSYVLPKSGGIGATIFYVFGGILAIGAGLILVTRRRARNSDF